MHQCAWTCRVGHIDVYARVYVDVRCKYIGVYVDAPCICAYKGMMMSYRCTHISYVRTCLDFFFLLCSNNNEHLFKYIYFYVFFLFLVGAAYVGASVPCTGVAGRE